MTLDAMIFRCRPLFTPLPFIAITLSLIFAIFADFFSAAVAR